MSSPADPLARWGLATRIAAAATAYPAVLVVQRREELTGGRFSPIVGWGCALGLIALPFLVGFLVARLRKRAARLRLAPQFLLLLPLGCLPLARPTLLAFAILALAQGVLLARAGSRRVAPWSLAAGPALLLGGLAVAPAPEWLLLFPLGLLAGVAGMLVLQAEIAAESETRPAGGRPPTVVAAAPSSRPHPITSLLYALPLTALLLVTIPLLLGLLTLLPDPMLGGNSARGEGEFDTESGEDASERAEVANARRAFERIFPSGVRIDRAGGPTLREDVMEVVPRPDGADRPAREVGPLYLRGVLLDTFLETGMVFGGGSPEMLLDDRSDGDGDGWTRLDTRRAPPDSRRDPLLLEISQQPVWVRDEARSILFAPEGTTAIDLEPIRYAPDGLLVSPPPLPSLHAETEWIDYSLLVEERRAERLDLSRARFGYPDRSSLQVPTGSPHLGYFRARAEEITRGARNDVERVAAIVTHFQEEYAYSLATRTSSGLMGLREFMEGGRGYCVQFATASALLLRSIRIPARVATGFLATEWSEEEERYFVDTTHGHAWLEVHFEGVGWVTFDPTPPQGREAMLASARRDPSSGLRDWTREVMHDLESWMASGDEAWLGTLGSTLADLPAALWRTLRRHPAAALAIVIGGGILLRLLRRRRDHASSPGTPRPVEKRRGDPVDLLWRKLVAALRRLGHHPRAAQTPREFAEEVVRRGGGTFRPLAECAELLYRSRYGSELPRPEELERASSFLEKIRQGAEAPDDRNPGPGNSWAGT